MSKLPLYNPSPQLLIAHRQPLNANPGPSETSSPAWWVFKPAVSKQPRTPVGRNCA